MRPAWLAATGIVVAACSSSGTSSSAPGRTSASPLTTSRAPQSAAAANRHGCPLLDADALTAIVGTHLTDHYASTTQPAADSPLAGTVLCDFADSTSGKTVKIARGDTGTVGTAAELMRKVQGDTGTSCPTLPGVGERAYQCADEQQAIVLADAGGQVVMAYRGGRPGGAPLADQAAAIAAVILVG